MKAVQLHGFEGSLACSWWRMRETRPDFDRSQGDGSQLCGGGADSRAVPAKEPPSVMGFEAAGIIREVSATVYGAQGRRSSESDNAELWLCRFYRHECLTNRLQAAVGETGFRR
jgi:hypothetical protein